MKKKDLEEKGISDLRTLAKKAGITAKRDWKKEDFLKALSTTVSGSKKDKKSAARTVSEKVVPVRKSSKTGAPKKAAPAKAAAKKQAAGKPAPRAASAGKTTDKVPEAKKSGTKSSAKTKPAGPAAATKTPVKPLRSKVSGTAKKTSSELLALAEKLKKALIKAPVSQKAALPKPARPGKGAVKKTAAAWRVTTVKPMKKTLAPGEIKPWRPSASSGKKRPAARVTIPQPVETTYGEDRVVAMAVTPTRLYTYWEITQETAALHVGGLNLRVTETESGEVFYVPISGTLDEMFISVSPGGKYLVEIGTINDKGEFVPMEQSPAEIYTAVSAAPPAKDNVRPLPGSALRHIEDEEGPYDDVHKSSEHISSY